MEIEVREPAPWPSTVYDVRKFGAIADGNADDAKAIQAALDAAGKNGGGVVLLPRGVYLINRPLKMPRKTVLRGETRDRTWIFTPNGIDGDCGKREDGLKMPCAITGNGEFGLEDLSLQTVYSPLAVMTPEIDLGSPVLADFTFGVAPTISTSDDAASSSSQTITMTTTPILAWPARS